MFPISKFKNLFLAALALLALCFFPSEGKATITGICDPDAPAQCAASINITGNILTVTLTNTSPAANDGFITAFAFNFTAGTVINNFTTTNANYNLFGAAPSGWTGSVSPDGSRTHLISATSNDYNGGGNPSGGAPSGGGTVTFTLTLASLNGNTEDSVFDSALVRSRGFEGVNPDSDKDGLTRTGGANPVPEPATMLLLGAGLTGVAAGVRRRRRKM